MPHALQGGAGAGSIAREDLAAVLAQASLHAPPGTGVKFQVASAESGALPDSWQQVFNDLHADPEYRLSFASVGGR